MHDPMIVAFEIRRPWPSIDTWKTEQAARTGTRWETGGAFWVVAGRGLYFPPMITVWHREPGNRDSGTVCKHHRRWQDADGAWQSRVLHGWRLHAHHWRVQIHPLQALRRSLLTRCTWCRGRSVKGDPVNISHQWNRRRGHWWQGEPGLFHHDCSSVERAHATCTCEQPVLEHGDYGRCSLCDLFRPFGMTAENIARARELSTIPRGGRRTTNGGTK